ncbi:MAG: CPBP family glutamic-type intramembrane protease [Methanofastidiosum sp.]
MIIELLGLFLVPDVKFKHDLYTSMIVFAVTFISTIFLLIPFRGYFVISEASLIWPLVFYSLFVGFGETYFFQGVLPKAKNIFPSLPFFGKIWGPAILSQMLFSLAHTYAYSVNSLTFSYLLSGLILAFLGGIFMYMLSEYVGLESAIAFHAGWDLISTRTLMIFPIILFGVII